jgi:hypothetical protein
VIILSFLAVVFGLYAYKLHGFSSLQGKALLIFTIGLFCWFLGETTWGIYEIILGLGKPIASVADVFWITGYPFLLLGLYYVWKITIVSNSKKRLLALIILIISGCFFMIKLAIPSLTDTKISIVEKVSTAGYVIGDAALLVALICVITHLFGGKFAKTWVLILLAIFITTIADIYYMNFSEVYETGNLIDLFWDFSYILMAFGFFYHREAVKDIIKTV